MEGERVNLLSMKLDRDESNGRYKLNVKFKCQVRTEPSEDVGYKFEKIDFEGFSVQLYETGLQVCGLSYEKIDRIGSMLKSIAAAHPDKRTFLDRLKEDLQATKREILEADR